MTIPFVDTDVIIRLLVGDDSAKQAQAAALLLEQIENGNLVVAAPDTVIADAVFVLASPRIYHIPAEVADLLSTLVRLPGFRVENRRIVLSALAIYAATPQLDFGDAMIITLRLVLRLFIDAHYHRFSDITQQNP